MIPNSSVVYQLIMGGYQQNQQRPPVVQNDAVDALLSLKKLNYEVKIIFNLLFFVDFKNEII